MRGHPVIRPTLVLLALSLVAGAARPQEPALDAQGIDTKAHELYDRIMSPFCPGRTLANCPSPQAATMREGVRRQLAAGMSDDEILDSIYAIYGEVVLGAPRAEGFGILAWVMPGVFLLLGVALLVAWLRSTERRAATQGSTLQPELDSEEQARLEAELSEL
ncbi:MAG: cytochrome c-type biogenesis protein CcmH [Gemmatimonadota bacterium]|nr:MAG: cytochrome c-type biogenesis protein CcmH [Gemmatimonadota bacterium]